MNTRLQSQILTGVIIGGVILSIGVTFYKTIILEDFVVVQSVIEEEIVPTEELEQEIATQDKDSADESEITTEQ